MKYRISPNSQSNLFAGEVSGVENYSNLFYTHPATYLPLILLWQPISKSYSRCPSLLSLIRVKNFYLNTVVIQVIVGVLHRVPAAQAQHLPPVLRHEDGHHAGREQIFKYVLKSESIS